MPPTAAGGPAFVPSSALVQPTASGSNAKAGLAMGAPSGGANGIGGAGLGAAGAGSAPGPEPRWKHTATVIDETRLLVFGGYKSSSQRCGRAGVRACVDSDHHVPPAHLPTHAPPSRRLNDVWILDTTKDKWWQPLPGTYVMLQTTKNGSSTVGHSSSTHHGTAHTEVDAEGNTVYRRRWADVPCPRCVPLRVYAAVLNPNPVS